MTKEEVFNEYAPIARICHNVNKAYCEALGDDSQPEFENAPEWMISSALDGVIYHLTNEETTAADSHVNWMAEKEADGWVYGKTKDSEAKTHPCMVPFHHLPLEQQMKDVIFKAIVDSFK